MRLSEVSVGSRNVPFLDLGAGHVGTFSMEIHHIIHLLSMPFPGCELSINKQEIKIEIGYFSNGKVRCKGRRPKSHREKVAERDPNSTKHTYRLLPTESAMERDRYMSPMEAQEFGILDKVLVHPPQDGEDEPELVQKEPKVTTATAAEPAPAST